MSYTQFTVTITVHSGSEAYVRGQLTQLHEQLEESTELHKWTVEKDSLEEVATELSDG